MVEHLIKITFIEGLREVVIHELSQYPQLVIVEVNNEEIYLNNTNDFDTILSLKSIVNAYIVARNSKFNPLFLSNHKSVLGDIIHHVLELSKEKFNTYILSCAGSNSLEIQEIKKYITEKFKLVTADDPDLKIFIGKTDDIWELGVAITKRPLSIRDYKAVDIKGGMNPTIAYAMNTLCNLSNASSYLNICSGGATLLIEAARINNNLKFLGFDKNGKTNALAVQNIKKAGLLKLIQLKTADVLENPTLGTFDVIVSDPPFGMLVSKNESLEILYSALVKYSSTILNPGGIFAVYTTEYELLTSALEKYSFQVIKKLDLKLSTSTGSYIYPSLVICTKK